MWKETCVYKQRECKPIESFTESKYDSIFINKNLTSLWPRGVYKSKDVYSGIVSDSIKFET